MAGTVLVSEGRAWAVSSWAFYWAVETLAEMVGSAPLAATLRSVEEHHLGCLDLADLPPEQRADVVAQIARLPQVAEETLAPSEARAGFVATVRELADLVASWQAEAS